MGASTRASTWTTKSRARAPSTGLTGASTKETGSTASKTELERIPRVWERRVRANGAKASASSGSSDDAVGLF